MDAQTLQQLADRQAITDVIYRYCRAMDRIDHALGYSVFHDDATVDYGAEVFQGSGRGFIEHVCEQHRRTLVHLHQVTNILIELDGDSAASEAYVFSDLRVGSEAQPKQVTTWGRYIDQWSRRDGRWAIDRRIAIRDFSEMRDVNPMLLPQRGQRDRTDPSYAVLRG
jgi:ketosteroid isomerase-like protein